MDPNWLAGVLAVTVFALVVVALRLRASGRELRARDDRLATVAHELRGPLQSIALAVARLKRDGALSPKSREAAEILERNLEAETRLVEDLFEATRGDRPLAVRPEPCDLNAVVREVVDAAADRASDKRLSVAVHLDPTRPPALADPVRLRQILRNLVDNAIKFTPPGGSVAVRTAQGDGRHVTVGVSDTGPGIPSAEQDRIFEPYAQLEPGRFGGGLGLGLFLVRKLAQAQSGGVTVSSEGRGATFTVSLPRAAVPVEGAPGAPSSPARILLVEDHEDSARLIAELLTSRGYSVDVAGGFDAALAVASKSDCDVVVSDIELPGGSGLDLMRKLSPMVAGGVALSGRRTEADLAASRAAGFGEHLVKPVDVDELVGAIERVRGKAG